MYIYIYIRNAHRLPVKLKIDGIIVLYTRGRVRAEGGNFEIASIVFPPIFFSFFSFTFFPLPLPSITFSRSNRATQEGKSTMNESWNLEFIHTVFIFVDEKKKKKKKKWGKF